MVDLAALRNALVNNELGGAAIDVYPVEPEKNGDTFITPLQGLSNVISNAAYWWLHRRSPAKYW